LRVAMLGSRSPQAPGVQEEKAAAAAKRKATRDEPRSRPGNGNAGDG
jgi:hypothetical protein